MRTVYATVEKVMRVTDVKATAFNTDDILDALISASGDVDNLVKIGDATRPGFAPWTGTIAFDWPAPVNNANAYRFWLNQFRLHSLTSAVSGGTDISDDVLLWPPSGAPYSAVEVDTETSSALEAGTGSGQRSLSLAGVWGIVGRDRTKTTWTLSASIDSDDETATLLAPVGVGSSILIGSERMNVISRSWGDSGQTATALTAQMNDQAITVSTGSAFLAGEELLIDGERVLVREISGNALTVQRAVGGSTLAAHSNGATIHWARVCGIERATLGTTAASHSSAAQISIYEPPALASQLTVAYAIDRRALETVGYARSLGHIKDRRQSFATIGGDTGAVSIPALEGRVISAFGRIRHRAI